MTKNTVVQIRCSEQELAAWKGDAKRRGLSLSEWVRRIANYTVGKEDPAA